MLSVNDLIERFRKLLLSSWPAVEDAARNSQDEELLGNWLEASWEIMLEGDLSRRAGHLVVLAPYGDGAEDMHHGIPEEMELFNRVSLPTMRPNYVVVGMEKALGAEGSPPAGGVPSVAPRRAVSAFGTFVTDGRFRVSPPFDVCILMDDEGLEHAFHTGLLDYWLLPITSDEA